MNKFYVYEHWLDEKCIYVGSGNKNRPYSFKRNEEYNNMILNRKEEVVVKIHSEHLDRGEAFKEEERLTSYYISIGHKLLLSRKGFKWTDESKDKFKGEKNGMYKKGHSEEAKRKISKAFTGEKHPMYGKGWKVKGEKNGMFGVKGEQNPNYGSKSASAKKLKVIDTRDGSIIRRFEYYRDAENYYKDLFSRKTIQRSVNENRDARILKKMNITFEEDKGETNNEN